MTTLLTGTTSTTGYVLTPDTTGTLVIKTGSGAGTTALTIDSSQNSTFAGAISPTAITPAAGTTTVSPISLTSGVKLTTAIAGAIEYDGKVEYFTPQGTQRGVSPAQQFYRLDSGLVGANATGAQNMLGVGVTLSANTVYAFEYMFYMAKAAGTTSHTISLLFGGTATLNNINYEVVTTGATSSGTALGTTISELSVNVATATVINAAQTNALYFHHAVIKGTVSINAGGTFIPQYSLSAAPGGAYTTQTGSYMSIYPIGAAGSNINVGTWA